MNEREGTFIREPYRPAEQPDKTELYLTEERQRRELAKAAGVPDVHIMDDPLYYPDILALPLSCTDHDRFPENRGMHFCWKREIEATTWARNGYVVYHEKEGDIGAKPDGTFMVNNELILMYMPEEDYVEKFEKPAVLADVRQTGELDKYLSKSERGVKATRIHKRNS